jgi:hypothetical protein
MVRHVAGRRTMRGDACAVVVCAVVVCAVVVCAVFGTSACSARYIRSTTPPDQPLPEHSINRNIVVVSVDGLRPDAIGTYRAPTLQRLMREGSFTLSASTIHPSKTLPSHTSMLTGQGPELHGVL